MSALDLGSSGGLGYETAAYHALQIVPHIIELVHSECRDSAAIQYIMLIQNDKLMSLQRHATDLPVFS